jgi:outer membrane lipoprotein-sorting protein
MSWIAGSFRDLNTGARLVVSPPAGGLDAKNRRTFSMVARVQVKMPDKVRFQVLSSSVPIFNRWILVQDGDRMMAYDPIGDRRLSTDFRRLTGHEPVRLDTTLNVLGVMFDPARYKYSLLGRGTFGGASVYRVRITFSPPRRVNAYTEVAYTELLVDANRYVPVASYSYTPRKELATTTLFRDFAKTPKGWAALQVSVRDDRGERVLREAYKEQQRLRAEAAKKMGTPPPPAQRQFTKPGFTIWLDAKGGVLVPRRIHGNGFDGATSDWAFYDTKVNTGLPDSAFRL